MRTQQRTKRIGNHNYFLSRDSLQKELLLVDGKECDYELLMRFFPLTCH